MGATMLGHMFLIILLQSIAQQAAHPVQMDRAGVGKSRAEQNELQHVDAEEQQIEAERSAAERVAKQVDAEKREVKRAADQAAHVMQQAQAQESKAELATAQANEEMTQARSERSQAQWATAKANEEMRHVGAEERQVEVERSRVEQVARQADAEKREAEQVAAQATRAMQQAEAQKSKDELASAQAHEEMTRARSESSQAQRATAKANEETTRASARLRALLRIRQTAQHHFTFLAECMLGFGAFQIALLVCVFFLLPGRSSRSISNPKMVEPLLTGQMPDVTAQQCQSDKLAEEQAAAEQSLQEAWAKIEQAQEDLKLQEAHMATAKAKEINALLEDLAHAKSSEAAATSELTMVTQRLERMNAAFAEAQEGIQAIKDQTDKEILDAKAQEAAAKQALQETLKQLEHSKNDMGMRLVEERADAATAKPNKIDTLQEEVIATSELKKVTQGLDRLKGVFAEANKQPNTPRTSYNSVLAQQTTKPQGAIRQSSGRLTSSSWSRKPRATIQTTLAPPRPLSRSIRTVKPEPVRLSTSPGSPFASRSFSVSTPSLPVMQKSSNYKVNDGLGNSVMMGA